MTSDWLIFQFLCFTQLPFLFSSLLASLCFRDSSISRRSKRHIPFCDITKYDVHVSVKGDRYSFAHTPHTHTVADHHTHSSTVMTTRPQQVMWARVRLWKWRTKIASALAMLNLHGN